MAFDSAVRTTWGSFWGELAVKIRGMQGYEIRDKSPEFDPEQGFTETGQWYVIRQPPSNDVVKYEAESDGSVSVMYGVHWREYHPEQDDPGGYFYSPRGLPPRYPNDPVSSFDGDDLSSSSHRLLTPISNMGFGESIPFDMTIEYSMSYSAGDGWAFWLRSTAGRSADSACANGFANLNRLWDYDNGEESLTAWMYHSPGMREANPVSVFNVAGGAGTPLGNNLGQRYERGPCSEVRGTVVANGRVNAKSELVNFPMVTPNVVVSDKYPHTILGTHDLWLWPNGGVSNGDIIENDNGTEIYQVFVDERGQNIENVGLKI